MDLLSIGPKRVENLAQQTGMSLANVSQHLKILLDARLVQCKKEGTYAIYNINMKVFCLMTQSYLHTNFDESLMYQAFFVLCWYIYVIIKCTKVPTL
ncbi:Bacterial regulatory protein, arsR family [compost metagenome]